MGLQMFGYVLLFIPACPSALTVKLPQITIACCGNEWRPFHAIVHSLHPPNSICIRSIVRSRCVRVVDISLTFDVQVHFVTAHRALRICGAAHVLAMRGLCDALQHQRLVGDDNATRREQLHVLQKYMGHKQYRKLCLCAQIE